MPSPVRHLVFASTLALFACKSSAEQPATSDVGVAETSSSDDALDDSGVVCPPPLGTAAPRPTKRPAPGPLDDTLRVNEIQLKATHNSYHVKTDTNVPDWMYGEHPLDVQLDAEGVRGLELDVHWNDDCGRYEVFHLTVLDEKTTCRVFTDCLKLIHDWSDAHLGHHLLFIHLEPKDAWDASIGEARFSALEGEILSVWPRGAIVTPDEVKGSSASLAAALTDHGWPTLGQTRGRLVFYMDRSDEMRDAYAHGRKDLDGRLLFTDSDLDDPFAAIRILNDTTTTASQAAIAAALARHQIVRVMSEATLAGALAGDGSSAPIALATGGQIESTDFPTKIADTPYFFTIPGGTPSRCNPVTAPASCTSNAVESPDRLATPK